MINKDTKPAGYTALIERYELNVMPHYRASYVTTRGQRRDEVIDGIEHVTYPKSYMPEDTIVAQLEFALKYDGINLEILKAIFNAIVEGGNITEIRQYILDHPTSKYTRKIWYLYEYLLDSHLSVPDVGRGNYVDLLESDKYFTCGSIKSSRHRINNNLLGNQDFCPVVRRSTVIESFLLKKLQSQVKDVVAQYPEDVITRASQYLYIKETKSSFEIEHEQPSQNRTDRFIDALQKAGQSTVINKEKLIELQNIIVDQRFADADYRTTQNYVGENLAGYREKIHYIAPRPEDVSSCMSGLLENMEKMDDSNVDFVVQAAVIAFGFVFIHPFEDGNGRIHRFLIHHILTRTGFTPENMIFPVSATMLAELKNYNNCFEEYSKKMMPLIQYNLKKDGVLVVENETADYYRYYDATKVVEYLFSVIEKTIQEDFINELDFIIAYSNTKSEIQDVIDLPDKLMDLFVKICLDNHYKMSKSKRSRFFSKLTDDEVIQLEKIISENFIKNI